MADSKEQYKDKPKSPPPSSASSWTILFGGIIALLLIGQGFSYLLTLLGFKDPQTGALNPHAISSFRISLANFLTTVQVVALFVSVLFIMGIIYVKFRMYEIKRLEKVRRKVEEISEKKIAEKPEPNRKWMKVTEHVDSSNPSDWRLAILEADILLNEVLEKMGYKGLTIGDKLKTIEPSDFTHLNEAWEAHKTRNSIAHEGSDFRMNQREAKRVISLYQKVFEEFYFI